MSKFVNTYRQDDSFIKEFAWSWIRRRSLSLYNQTMIIAIFVIGCLLLRFGIESSVLYTGLISVIVAIAAVVNVCINVRTMVKTTKDRIRFYSTEKEYQTEFTEEKCIVNRNDKEHTLEVPLASIEDHWESRHYYYVLFPGSVVAALSKVGFTVGSSEEFENFIEKFSSRRGKRLIILGIALTVLVIVDLLSLVHAIQTYRAVGWLLPLITSSLSK